MLAKHMPLDFSPYNRIMKPVYVELFAQLKTIDCTLIQNHFSECALLCICDFRR
jgi:hypothetical protein